MNRSLLRALRAAPERPDGHLLARYARHRDEEAFALLVRRHAAMVLGVCRRVLGNRADADDAFQATFLVLARKAVALDGRESVAGWLHGVAFNIARKLRHMNAQRKARERRPVPESQAPDSELLTALDEELNHLPEKYRTVVVLCDLEGLTRKEAARRLGCPEGTVAGRLARARSRLAAQLAGRGLAPAALVGVTAGELAAVPPELIGPILDAAAISPRVLALTEGALKAMFLQKLRAALGVLVVCALAFAGFSRVAATDPEVKADDPPVVKPVAKAEASEKRLTVIPLRKLDAATAAQQVLASLTRDLGNPVTVVPADHALLVYADDAATRQIEAIVQKLGEPKMVGTVVKLRTAKAEAVAALLTRQAPARPPALRDAGGLAGATPHPEKVTVVPVSGENAVLIYAEEWVAMVLADMARMLVELPDGGTVLLKGEKTLPQTTVIPLRNVAASEAAKVVGEVFNGPGRDGSRVRVTFDAPTNTLIVQASPADLEVIRKLLDKVIDSEPAKNPDEASVSLLTADVETLRDRVKYAEGMVKKGFMTATQLAAEQSRLKDAEDKLAAAKRRADALKADLVAIDREVEMRALRAAIDAQTKLLALVEERVKRSGGDSTDVTLHRTQLTNLQFQLDKLQKAAGLQPPGKGR